MNRQLPYAVPGCTKFVPKDLAGKPNGPIGRRVPPDRGLARSGAGLILMRERFAKPDRFRRRRQVTDADSVPLVVHLGSEVYFHVAADFPTSSVP